MNKYKSIWISDVHLGIKYAKVDVLTKFLKENECEKLFLVGDFIDGWSLKRKWYWDEPHNLLIQKILRKSRKGTEIIYLTGNHDDFLRFFGDTFDIGNIRIVDRYIHTTVNGKHYLVIHGDEFDGILNAFSFISHIGSWLYDIVLFINHRYNKIRFHMGWEPQSLAQKIKSMVKGTVSFINKFEVILSDAAHKAKVDGVICGHIHHACHKKIEGIEYWNCGSWLEDKCSAVVEHMDGRLELIYIE